MWPKSVNLDLTRMCLIQMMKLKNLRNLAQISPNFTKFVLLSAKNIERKGFTN